MVVICSSWERSFCKPSIHGQVDKEFQPAGRLYLEVEIRTVRRAFFCKGVACHCLYGRYVLYNRSFRRWPSSGRLSCRLPGWSDRSADEGRREYLGCCSKRATAFSRPLQSLSKPLDSLRFREFAWGWFCIDFISGCVTSFQVLPIPCHGVTCKSEPHLVESRGQAWPASFCGGCLNQN